MFIKWLKTKSGHVIEEDWQLSRLCNSSLDLAIIHIFMRNKIITRFGEFKPIFFKHFIQKFPLTNSMRLDFNYLKVEDRYCRVIKPCSKNLKKEFLTPKNLRRPQICGLKTNLVEEPSRTNLKPHNIPLTPKLIKKVITNFGLSKSFVVIVFLGWFWRSVNLEFYGY